MKYRKYGKEGISKSKLEVGIHSRYSKGTEEFDKLTKKGGNGRWREDRIFGRKKNLRERRKDLKRKKNECVIRRKREEKWAGNRK